MDYNYVRMRNAIKAGDTEAAARYKHLYETGTEKARTVSVLDCAIVILLAVAMLLSAYILYSEQKITESDMNRVTETQTAMPDNSEVR